MIQSARHENEERIHVLVVFKISERLFAQDAQSQDGIEHGGMRCIVVVGRRVSAGL